MRLIEADAQGGNRTQHRRTWTAIALLWLTILLALPGAGNAFAIDRIIDRQLLEDPGGTLEISDVLERQFDPMPQVFSGGYTDSAFWLRIVVEPRNGGEWLFLRAWPTYLDSLTLYAPDGAGGWTTRQSGDTIALDQRLPTAALAFEIRPESPTTYYLRLKTTSTSMISVAALEPTALYTEDILFGVGIALVLGLMLAMLAWGAYEYVTRREQLMLWYVLTQTTSIIYSFAISGYLALLLPGLVLDEFTSVLVCLTVATQTTFYVFLLRGFEPPPLALKAFALIPLCSVPILLLLGFGGVRLALQLNAVLVVIGPLVFTVVAILARHNAPPGLVVLRVAGVAQSLALVVTALPLLALTEATALTRHGTLLLGAASGMLAFALLLARSRQILAAARAAQVAQRQLELERHEHDVRGRFLALLAHELRTPLSVARLSLGAVPMEGGAHQRLSQAIDSIDGLIDLSAYAERLEQGQLQVDREEVALDETLRELLAELPGAGRVALAPVPPLRIRTDPRLFELVLRNLVDNALKYSPADSEVEVSVKGAVGKEDGVSILVENEAARAELPDPAKMFEKFYRGPGASARTGLGIGLYLARGLGELLGCRVDCELDGRRVRLSVWHPC